MMGPNTVWQSPLICGQMAVWDVDTGMCEGFPMEGRTMTMLMLHGNLFGSRVWESGLRGRDAWAGPDMVMADLGTTVGDRHYLNVDLMLTAEKWLFPEAGYPLLMQIGESNTAGVPFIDAQHPHSSPIMGLTFSDTIALGAGKEHLKMFFAPRGEATDGPIAFMLGASLQLGDDRFEASAYNGTAYLGKNRSPPANPCRAFSPPTAAMPGPGKFSCSLGACTCGGFKFAYL